jgi:pimeloyl-ACP methyl ester carboxylesterase
VIVAGVAMPASADDLKRRGMIGIQIGPTTEEGAKAAGLDSAKGITVAGLIPGLPAGEAGIEANDIIFMVAGTETPDMPAFQNAMRGYYAGDEVKFTIARAGQTVEKTVKLGERPKETSTDYDVIYDSTTAAGHRIRTIVTKPRGEGKSPAIVVVPGMGGDALEFGQPFPNPFKSVIDELTKAGYVTVRTHLIGAGDSEGPSSQNIDLKNEVACHKAAIDAVKKYDFVDANNVYLLGVSVGTRVAPLVAEGADIRGVITYAAFARPWIESQLEGAKRRAELQGMSEEEQRTNAQQLQTFMQQCYVDKQSPADVLTKYPELRELTSQFLQNDTYIMGRHYSYFQELANRDAAADWKKVDAPVLAMWGAADYVANKADSEFLVAQVNAAHAGNAEFVTIEGTDHNLDRMADMEESFLAGFAGDFNPEIIIVAKKWMESKAKQ